MSNRVIKNKSTQFVTSTLTNKGDILTRNNTEIVRLPVGTNGQVLTADSATPEGIKWGAGGGGGGTWQPREIFIVDLAIQISGQVILSSTPLTNSEIVTLNGLVQDEGLSYEYTIVTNTITFTPGLLLVGDRVTVRYQI